jgi:Tfp pilus assembly protein PilO
MDLGDGVKAYNEYMESINETREQVKAKREEKKEKFVKNHALVAEINNLHT